MTGTQRAPGESLGIAALPNLRDVGGYPTRDGGRVRTGLLYRSNELGGLGGADAAAFARLGIRSIYDLRTEGERIAQPDRLPPGTEHIVADVIRDSSDASPARLMRLLADPRTAGEAFGPGGAAAMWAAKYREFVALPSARAGYRRLFTDLVDERHRPALVHCTTGKDRVGWAVAALFMLLGVPDDLVMADYLLSGRYLRPVSASWLERFAVLGGDPELLRPLAEVRPEYLAAATDEMGRLFGTIEGYFDGGLGIDAAGRSALRATFVERG